MKILSLLIIFTLVFACTGNSDEPVIIADFDSGTYRGWQVEGTAFDDGPGVEIMAYLGKAHATSLNSNNEPATGTLTSPPFIIRRNYIHFLLGAREIDYVNGTMKNPDDLAVQLLIGGSVERQAIPEEFHGMFHRAWDVSDLQGKEARICILDKDNREGVFIDVDHIVQNNIYVEGIITDRIMKVTHDNLNIPIKRGSPRYYFEIFVEDQQVRAFEAELATDDIDYWVVTDLSPWSGKEIKVRTRQYFEDKSGILNKLAFDDGIIDSDDLYQEELRPQIHFSAKRGWLNDPNGLVYYDGEYHLFYQANPFGWDHSLNDYNKTWGHAVSKNLVHWTELPAAIHPDHLGSIYSGSAVVDCLNTTGFKNTDEAPIVAVYTSAGTRNRWSLEKKFTQSIAYSIDRGRTFTKYEDNPVQRNLGYINRDPKAIWYEPDKCWVIVLYLDHEAFAFFTSGDLKSWEEQSRLPIQAFGVNDIGAFEDCPELFELPVDGNSSNKKWILYAGAGDYVLGDFNGKVFTPQSKVIKYNYGDCFYASQTFNNMPAEDGRRIQIAWAWVEFPGMTFNQQMTFPVALTLRKTEQGLRMFAYPVKEIENLYEKKHSWHDTQLEPGHNILCEIKYNWLDIDLEFIAGGSEHVGFIINGRKIDYDVNAHVLKSGEQEAPLQSVDGKIRLRIVVDKLTAEVFANDGSVYMPLQTNPAAAQHPIEIYSEGEHAQVNSLVVHELKSIWK
jgi:fructan beta-fructosidase